MRPVGAIAVLVSLWLPWYFNDDPPGTATGWEVFVHADVVLAVTAVVAGLLAPVPAAIPRLAGPLAVTVAAGCWLMVGVCVDRLWAFSPSTPFPADPRAGAYVAIAGFALLAIGWTWSAWRHSASGR